MAFAAVAKNGILRPLLPEKRCPGVIDFNDPYFLERKHKADELQALGVTGPIDAICLNYC